MQSLKKLLSSCKVYWKLLYSLKYFKCIALIKISLWCAVFAVLWLLNENFNFIPLKDNILTLKPEIKKIVPREFNRSIL